MAPKDSQVWSKTPNGTFTVNSAYKVTYKLLKEASMVNSIFGCFDNSKMQALWKAIWNLKCPSKIKHFVWRACRNILPTKYCLKQRKVIIDDKCELCGEKEATRHMLWGCKTAKDTWEALIVKNANQTPPLEEFIDVVWWLGDQLGVIDWKVFASITWSLWNNKNAVRHGGQGKQGRVISMEAQKYIKEFRAHLPSNPPKIIPPPKKWSPSPLNWYKVNVDGTVFRD